MDLKDAIIANDLAEVNSALTRGEQVSNNATNLEDNYIWLFNLATQT